MRWQTFGAAALIVVGVGAAAIAVVGPSLGGTAATQYLTSQAVVTDVVEEVAATGTLEAATTYALAFGTAPTEVTGSTTGSTGGDGAGTSWLVATVSVTPGQAVKAGDVLATAGTDDAELALAAAEATLASARARLTTDLDGLTDTQRAAAKLQVTEAKRSVTQAQASYANTVAQNRLKLKQAEAAVDRARATYRSIRAAGEPEAAVEQALAALTQAKESLATLRLQVSQSNTQAANQVSQAELGLESSRLSYREKTASADDATIATDEAAVAQAEQAVATAQSALDYATLVSPVDGVVVSVNVTAGLAAPTADAITVRSTTFQVAAAVTESDLPLVTSGQAATVTIAAFDDSVEGTVTAIDQQPASSSTGVVSYGIVIDLPEVPTGTMPGMSAEITIATASAADVLAVPAIALQATADGSYAVRVLDGTGEPQTVAVEVGLVTSSLAEITSGIEAGTAVVVGTASDRQSTTTTTTTRIPGLEGGGFPGSGPGTGPGQRP
jgi:HlyD family secretion protein